MMDPSSAAGDASSLSDVVLGADPTTAFVTASPADHHHHHHLHHETASPSSSPHGGGKQPLEVATAAGGSFPNAGAPLMEDEAPTTSTSTASTTTGAAVAAAVAAEFHDDMTTTTTTPTAPPGTANATVVPTTTGVVAGVADAAVDSDAADLEPLPANPTTNHDHHHHHPYASPAASGTTTSTTTMAAPMPPSILPVKMEDTTVADTAADTGATVTPHTPAVAAATTTNTTTPATPASTIPNSTAIHTGRRPDPLNRTTLYTREKPPPDTHLFPFHAKKDKYLNGNVFLIAPSPKIEDHNSRCCVGAWCMVEPCQRPFIRYHWKKRSKSIKEHFQAHHPHICEGGGMATGAAGLNPTTLKKPKMDEAAFFQAGVAALASSSSQCPPASVPGGSKGSSSLSWAATRVIPLQSSKGGASSSSSKHLSLVLPPSLPAGAPAWANALHQSVAALGQHVVQASAHQSAAVLPTVTTTTIAAARTEARQWNQTARWHSTDPLWPVVNVHGFLPEDNKFPPHLHAWETMWSPEQVQTLWDFYQLPVVGSAGQPGTAAATATMDESSSNGAGGGGAPVAAATGVPPRPSTMIQRQLLARYWGLTLPPEHGNTTSNTTNLVETEGSVTWTLVPPPPILYPPLPPTEEQEGEEEEEEDNGNKVPPSAEAGAATTTPSEMVLDTDDPPGAVDTTDSALEAMDVTVEGGEEDEGHNASTTTTTTTSHTTTAVPAANATTTSTTEGGTRDVLTMNDHILAV